jgi:predicted transcriptional regulator
MAASITLQMDEKLKQELDSIAKTTERSTAVVVNDALKAYVDLHSWQVAQIEKGMRSAREIGTVPDEEVEAWMLSWGTENELPMPTVKRGFAG